MSRVKRWLKWIGLLAAAGVLVYLALLALVLGGGRDRVEGEPATMIILGCQVHTWGPSVLLQDRLDEALDYLESHRDMTIIVSGGQGPDEHTSEARVMRDYLVDHGAAPDRIRLEEHSHNTFQNLTYSVRLMEELGLDAEDGVLVVSNGFHLTRVRLLWGRVCPGAARVSTLAAPSSHAGYALWMNVREPLALVKSYLIDR